MVTSQLRLGTDIVRPAAGGTSSVYINFETAAWCKVELANSKVFTFGVPSITVARAFSTSGYTVSL